MSEITDAIDATTEQEVWRDIPGWEGLYQASSFGRIRSLKREGEHRSYGGRVLKGSPDSYGYRLITLSRRGQKRRNLKASLLVCLAFHGPKPRPGVLSQVAHGDGVRTNDRSDNLRWATPMENDHDKDIHGTRARGERCGNAKINDEIARTIYLAQGSAWKIARKYGLVATTVQKIKNRQTWRAATDSIAERPI